MNHVLLQQTGPQIRSDCLNATKAEKSKMTLVRTGLRRHSCYLTYSTQVASIVDTKP